MSEDVQKCCPWWWAWEGQDGKEDTLEGAVKARRGNVGFPAPSILFSQSPSAVASLGVSQGKTAASPWVAPFPRAAVSPDSKACHRIWSGKKEHYHFTPTRTALIRKKGTKTVGEDVEKLEPSHAAGVAAIGNTVAVPQKVTHRVTKWSRSCTPRIYPREQKNKHLHKNLSMNVHSSSMAGSPKVDMTQMPPMGEPIKKMGFIHMMEWYSPRERNEVWYMLPHARTWEH